MSPARGGVPRAQLGAGRPETDDLAWEQVKAFEELMVALDAASAAGLYGERVKARCQAAAMRWRTAAAGETAFAEVDLAAGVAGLIALRAPAPRLSALAGAVAAAARAAPCKPLRPIPDHIQRRDAAISGE